MPPAPGRGPLASLVILWRHRALVVSLARRDIQATYVGSVLGALWTVLGPLVQFGLYFTVFGYFFGMRSASASGMSGFGVFLLSGLAPYLVLQEVAARAAGFARQQAALVSRIAIPLEVLLGGTVLAVLARHAVALVLVLVFSAATGLLAVAHLPWLLLGLVLVPLAAWGLALLLGVLGAYLPDVSQLVTTGSLVVFFLTPIGYPVEVVPRAVRALLVANPLYDLIALIRALTIGVAPTPVEIATAAGSTALLWLLGSLAFSRRALRIPDLV